MTDTTKLIAELEELKKQADKSIAYDDVRVVHFTSDQLKYDEAAHKILPELIAKIRELDSLLTGSAEETRQTFPALYHVASTTIPELKSDLAAAVARAEKAEAELSIAVETLANDTHRCPPSRGHVKGCPGNCQKCWPDWVATQAAAKRRAGEEVL